MENVKYQKVFDIVSVGLAALITLPVCFLFIEEQQNTESFVFTFSVLIFLLFSYVVNLKTKKIKPLLNSFITTYASYTFLVLLAIFLNQMVVDNNMNLENYFTWVGIYLLYGYVLCIAISLVVFLLYWLTITYQEKD